MLYYNSIFDKCESFPGTRIRPWTSIFVRQVTGFSQLFLLRCPQAIGQIRPIPRRYHGIVRGIELPSGRRVPRDSQRWRSATRKSVQAGNGDGFHLLKKPSGTRLWRMNYTHMGRQKTLSSGEWPLISLAGAREKRDEARRRLAAGLAPSEGRKLEQMRVEARREGYPPSCSRSSVGLPTCVRASSGRRDGRSSTSIGRCGCFRPTRWRGAAFVHKVVHRKPATFEEALAYPLLPASIWTECFGRGHRTQYDAIRPLAASLKHGCPLKSTGAEPSRRWRRGTCLPA